MPVTNAQILFALKRMSDEMKRLVESIVNMVSRQSMFGGAGGGSVSTKIVEVDFGDTNDKLDDIIEAVDEVEDKQDLALVELEAINDNTVAAGGETAAESLVHLGQGAASGVISAAGTVVGAVFSGTVSMASTLVLAGTSVLIAGGVAIAGLTKSLLDNSDLVESDVDEIRLLTIDQKRSYHYAAKWDTVSGPGFFTMIQEFKFNEDFDLHKFFFNRTAGTGPSPTATLRYKDGEEGNEWAILHTFPAGTSGFVSFDFSEHKFPETFVLRAEIGVVWTGGGDIYNVGIVGRHQGDTVPTITVVTAHTETIFRNHTHF